MHSILFDMFRIKIEKRENEQKKKKKKFIDELCQRMCSYIPAMLPKRNA